MLFYRDGDILYVHTDMQADRQTDTNRHAGRQTDRQTQTQAGGQAGRRSRSSNVMGNVHKYTVIQYIPSLKPAGHGDWTSACADDTSDDPDLEAPGLMAPRVPVRTEGANEVPGNHGSERQRDVLFATHN
jgi:hypothetical protein